MTAKTQKAEKSNSERGPQIGAYLKYTDLSKPLQVYLFARAIIFFLPHSDYAPYPHTF